MSVLRRLFFWWRYLRGKAAWDTGITPPEVTSLIETGALQPGLAVDLGCGTGTNAIYLAQHGWTVVGIDFVARAIQKARLKAREAGVEGKARFAAGDVTRLVGLVSGMQFDLAVDIGCMHSLQPDQQLAYASNLGQVIKPGGTFLLYMFRPTAKRLIGMQPSEVETLFAKDFRLAWSGLGEDSAADASSAWYRFERK